MTETMTKAWERWLPVLTLIIAIIAQLLVGAYILGRVQTKLETTAQTAINAANVAASAGKDAATAAQSNTREIAKIRESVAELRGFVEGRRLPDGP